MCDVLQFKASFRATLKRGSARFEYLDFDYSRVETGPVEVTVVPDALVERYVRCYVSASYSDMQAERRLLAQEVFPTLRQRCIQLGVQFVEVDFGWGVPESIAERKSSIMSRLLEIRQNVKTYIIGLVGEKYGYTYMLDAKPSHGSLDPLFVGKRPTVLGLQEVELDEGALSRDIPHKAFYYFRDSRYLDQVEALSERKKLQSEGMLARERLSNMKNRMLVSQVHVHQNYASPEDVANTILQDLTTQIVEDFPNDFTRCVTYPRDDPSPGNTMNTTVLNTDRLQMQTRTPLLVSLLMSISVLFPPLNSILSVCVCICVCRSTAE